MQGHGRQPLGNHGDIGDVSVAQHAVGHQEVGDLGRLVERKDGDDRPLAFRRTHGLYRPRVLGVVDGRGRGRR
jgi:hypothetical protein